MDIQLENVSYINQGKTILNDINWQVRTGENWILFGLNGSGKTTLLNLITGYFYPSKGKAEVLGYTFGKAPLSELRKHIGWVSSALNEKIPSEVMQNALNKKGFMVSARSTCASKSDDPSYVLSAMGYSSKRASSCIRISLTYHNTEEEIASLIDSLKEIISQYG